MSVAIEKQPLGATPRLNTRRLMLAALALFLIPLLLTACSSGGGGSSSPPAPAPTSPPPPPAPAMPFPRTSPAVTIAPDDSGYAARKAEFEDANEYESRYVITSPGSLFGVDAHLELINAAAAYARGATGAGETVVVVDSGIDVNHPELSGKATLVPDIGYFCTPPEYFAGECAGAHHGTAVASLLAGKRSGSSSGLDIHGVAFDAQIKFIPIRLRGSDPEQPPLLELNAYTWTGDDSIDFDSSEIYNQYIAHGEILNFSFASPWSLVEWRQLGSGCESTGSETGPYACYKYYYRANAEALAQASKAPADRSIVVVAAGNNTGVHHALHTNNDGQGPLIDATSPSASNALAVAFNAPGDPDLAHVVTVVAVGAEGEIASYSNRCGLAKSFCVAAPGGDLQPEGGGLLVHAVVGTGYWLGEGTSFAAPIVSGSLAVLRQFFRGQHGTGQSSACYCQSQRHVCRL